MCACTQARSHARARTHTCLLVTVHRELFPPVLVAPNDGRQVEPQRAQVDGSEGKVRVCVVAAPLATGAVSLHRLHGDGATSCQTGAGTGLKSAPEEAAAVVLWCLRYLVLLFPVSLAFRSSSISGPMTFSAVSIRTLKVGSTMKSMNPAHRENSECLYAVTIATVMFYFAPLRVSGGSHRSATVQSWWLCGRTGGRRGVPDPPPYLPGRETVTQATQTRRVNAAKHPPVASASRRSTRQWRPRRPRADL